MQAKSTIDCVHLRLPEADRKILMGSWTIHEPGLRLPNVSFTAGRGKSHALLAGVRAIGEDLAVQAAGQQLGRDIIDVGGNASRHSSNRPSVMYKMWFVVPNLIAGDVARQKAALALCPMRVYPEMLTIDNAKRLLVDGRRQPGVPICVHSIYYLDDELLHHIIQLCGEVISVEHSSELLSKDGRLAFWSERPDGKTTARVEIEQATWTVSEDQSSVKFYAQGNAFSYEHPIHPRRGLVRDVVATSYIDGDVWSEVVRYTRADNYKPVPSAEERREENILDARARVVNRMLSRPADAKLLTSTLHMLQNETKTLDLEPDEYEDLAVETFEEVVNRMNRMSAIALRVASQRRGLIRRVTDQLDAAIDWMTAKIRGPSSAGSLHSAAARAALTRKLLEDPVEDARDWSRIAKVLAVLVSLLAVGATMRASYRPLRSRVAAVLSALQLQYKWALASLRVPTVTQAWLGTWPFSARALETRPRALEITSSCCTVTAEADDDCDHAPSVAAMAVGYGLPVDVSVFHTCPRTARRAVERRVLAPHTAKPRPTDWDDGSVYPEVKLRPDVQSWLDKYVGEKRRCKLEGAAESVVDMTRDGHVKAEVGPGVVRVAEQVASSATDTEVDKDPRWITSCTPSVSALWGPAVTEYSAHCKATYNGKSGDAFRVVYAIGYTGEELGAIRTRADAMFAGAETVTRSTDAARFDAHVQDWMNESELLDICRSVEISEHDQALMRKDINRTRLSSKYVKAAYSARRRSGDDITSCGNTNIQRKYWQTVARRCRDVKPAFRMFAIVGGDDGSITYEPEYTALVDAEVARLSLESDLSISFEESRFAEFYSSLWVPSLHTFDTPEGPSNWLLLPKPGRALVKSSIHVGRTSPQNLQLWWARNILAYERAWVAVPVLRSIVNLNRDAAAVIAAARPDEEKRWGPSAGWLGRHEVNWDYWEDYLNAPRAVIEDFESHVGSEENTSFAWTHTLRAHPLVPTLVAHSGYTAYEDDGGALPLLPRMFRPLNNRQLPLFGAAVVAGLGGMEEVVTHGFRKLGLAWPVRIGQALIEARHHRLGSVGIIAKVAWFCTLEMVARRYGWRQATAAHAAWNMIVCLLARASMAGCIGPVDFTCISSEWNTPSPVEMTKKIVKHQSTVARPRLVAAPQRPLVHVRHAPAPQQQQQRSAIPALSNAANVASEAKRLAGSTNPSLSCHAEARAFPAQAEARCLALGGTLASARNPNGVRSSQCRQLKYVLPVVCDGTGTFIARLFPNFTTLGFSGAGTIGGIAAGTVVPAPNLAELVPIVETYRVIGWQASLRCNQPALSNGGTIRMACERPGPFGGKPTVPNITASYIDNSPGKLNSTVAKGGVMVGQLGAAQAIAGYNYSGLYFNDIVTYDSDGCYTEIEMDPVLAVGGSFNSATPRLFQDILDTMVIRVDGASAGAAFTLTIDMPTEFTMVSTYEKQDAVHAGGTGTTIDDMNMILSRGADVAGIAATVGSGAWSGIKAITRGASAVPGLADAAAVAGDAEFIAEGGGRILKAGWNTLSSFYKAMH